jgi:DNA-binding CsgD family transcriptional regulator
MNAQRSGGRLNVRRTLDAVRIASPDDVRSCAIAFRDFANTLFPCRIAAQHDVAGNRQMRDASGAVLATEVFGWTEADKWWRTPHMAFASPLPIACRFEAEPFWANRDGIRTRGRNRWVERIDLADFESRTFARAALVVPIHLPFSRIGGVSFIPLDSERTDLSREYEAYSDVLGLAARTFVASYRRVMVRPERIPVGSMLLSKREVACLRWAAVGKTDDEIATIISRSRATVRFHVKNAAVKLGAVNRSQAVFKAAQLGYIGLD